MATTIEMQLTNYNLVTDNGTMKLEGTFNIDMNGKMNYNVSIYLIEDMKYIGDANYCELDGGLVNYNYNLPAANKADVIALVDTSIQEIKVKQSAE